MPTKIPYADDPWNFATGCDGVSPGCWNCFARIFAERWRGTPGHYFEHGFDFTLRPNRLDDPFRWRKSRRVFTSMTDPFHDAIPDGYLARVWDVMARNPQHTFLLTTKRHGRMRSWVRRWADTADDNQVAPIVAGGLPPMPRGPEAVRAVYTSGRARLFADMLESMGTPPEGCAYPLYDWMEGPRWWPAVLPNVWLGVSVEDQQRADLRIPALIDTPAAVRWVSAEPLLGPVDLTLHLESAAPCPRCNGTGTLPVPGGGVTCPVCLYDRRGGFGPSPISWVVCGGESGRRARPMHPDWARSLRDQTQAAGVPFYFKQHGEWAPTGERGIGCLDPRELLVGDPDGQGFREVIRRVGKRAAGRELDGRTWDQYPGAVS